MFHQGGYHCGQRDSVLRVKGQLGVTGTLGKEAGVFIHQSLLVISWSIIHQPFLLTRAWSARAQGPESTPLGKETQKYEVRLVLIET